MVSFLPDVLLSILPDVWLARLGSALLVEILASWLHATIQQLPIGAQHTQHVTNHVAVI